jgi:hypothetical protein
MGTFGKQISRYDGGVVGREFAGYRVCDFGVKLQRHRKTALIVERLK